MQVKLTQVRDLLTPSLKRKLKQAKNPTKALKAMGTVVVTMTQRAFTDADVRPSTWAPLKAKTLKARQAKRGLTASGKKKKVGTAPLMDSGTLSRSPRITKVTTKTVTVGSDRPYAAPQQRGTKRGVPPRPFFPFTQEGRPTEKAKTLTLAAVDRALEIEKK